MTRNSRKVSDGTADHRLTTIRKPAIPDRCHHCQATTGTSATTHDDVIVRWISRWWRLLRWWSGDDAYERYCAEHRDHGHPLKTRREFYRDYFDRQGKRPRCC